MKIDEALNIIKHINHKPQNSEVLLDKAYGMVLCEDVFARLDMPSFTNSAMDGFAYNSSDKNTPLVVQKEVFAGDFEGVVLKSGHAVRIMTGGKVPTGADSVLKIEDASFDDNGNLLIPANAKDGANIRKQGEEFKKGTPILKKGDRLDSIRLMMLASQGIYKVRVYKKLEVGIFASGKELYEPFASATNCVYNSNVIGVKTLFDKYADTSYLGILQDEYDRVFANLSAYENYDVLVTIGAASVGDKDYMNEALLELGFERVIGGLKIKPAGPTKIYQKDGHFVLVLPGNPMSAYFGACVFGIPLLCKLMGMDYTKQGVVLKSDEEVQVRNGRENLILCNIKDSHFISFLAGNLSSGQISPLNLCTHYANIDQSMQIGQEIKIYELDK